jgi:hypothetical protein
MADKLVITVTFDETRGGYVGTAPELRAPVVALSLGGLRRKAEALFHRPDGAAIVVLNLDRGARLERDRRRGRDRGLPIDSPDADPPPR